MPRLAAALPLVCLLLPACSQQVYVPPTRPMLLHTARTVGAGQTSVQAQASTGGAMFGPEVSAGNVQIHRGLTERLDVAVDGTVYHVHDGSASRSDPNVYAVRVGVRGGLDENLAFVAGVGAGSSAGGPFVSADAGVVLSVENRYLVPFLSLVGSAGRPLDPLPVDVTVPDDERRQFDTPRPTLGVGGTLGVRLPLGWTPERGAPLSLVAGLGYHHLRDADSDEGYAGFGFGVESNF